MTLRQIDAINVPSNRCESVQITVEEKDQTSLIFKSTFLDAKFEGIDYLACLNLLRQEIEPRGWRLLCVGARKDAVISGMARSMSGGMVVYLWNEEKRKANSLAPAPLDLVTTLEEQREHQRTVVSEPVEVAARQRYLGCLTGLAIGDALGTTNEFAPRDSFQELTDIVGGGPFQLQPGQWTDDTSMALCLAESLIEKRAFDARDQMNRYLKWWKEGYLSSTGNCFDIGLTVRSALARYEMSGEPFSGITDPASAGNGSIMRLAPVAMFYANDVPEVTHFCGESSRTTHGATECIEACQMFGLLLSRILRGEDRLTLFDSLNQFAYSSPKLREIANGSYMAKTSAMLNSTGYVVDTLETAIYCFRTTGTFSEAVLKAANLGGDADTVAAVCGQMAGAFYGIEGIPEHWKAKLSQSDLIFTFAEGLMPQM